MSFKRAEIRTGVNPILQPWGEVGFMGMGTLTLPALSGRAAQASLYDNLVMTLIIRNCSFFVGKSACFEKAALDFTGL